MEICQMFGSDDEDKLFATVHYRGRIIIFEFASDPTRFQTLPSLVVRYHYTSPDEGSDGYMFPDDEAWCQSVRSLINFVVDPCWYQHTFMMPDELFEIYEDEQGDIRSRVVQEAGYQKHIEQHLWTMENLREEPAAMPAFPATDHSNIVHLSHNLGNRGACELVRLRNTFNGLFVYQGISLITYLGCPEGIEAQVSAFNDEAKITPLLPKRPNVLAADTRSPVYVTIQKIDDNQESLICGILTPYIGKGTLDDQVVRGVDKKIHTTLMDKANWCLEMSKAIAYIHHGGKPFHMDIKPSNVLLDDNKDLILPDWEHGSAPTCLCAPEADGTWDVEEVDRELVYTKYRGPPRQNASSGRPKWDVFSIWRDECPRALEKAEVYSLGKTMWMLLQRASELEEVLRDGRDIFWTRNDVPEEWKELVSNCVELDPNRRIGLSDLVRFWKRVRDETGFFESCIEGEKCLIAQPFL